MDTQVFKEPVFFTTAANATIPTVIDTAQIGADGNYQGAYSKKTLAQMQETYPDAQIGEFDVVIAQREAAMISEPMEITEEQFTDALEVLPPLDYRNIGSCCSFKCEERLSGRITAVYAFDGSRHYAFNDVDTIKHDAIVAKIRAKFPLN